MYKRQVECIVRGYITGSGWESYQKNGTVCGIKLPEGLQESDKLPEPIYTPTTKAEIGDHDEHVSFEDTVDVYKRQPFICLTGSPTPKRDNTPFK